MIRSATRPTFLSTRPLWRLTQALASILARHRGRQSLALLDAHLLRDIGLSPDQARTECAKPFWQA